MNIMKVLAGVLLFTVFAACDTPQRTRDPFGTATTPLDNGPSQVFDQDDDNGGDPQTSDDGINEDPSDPNSDPGFETCDLNFRFFASNIGYVGICQSEQSENNFKVKMSMAAANPANGTCFVPIHIQANNTSFKLGIAECVKQDANQVYDMTLTKDRPEEINGVMIVKAYAINAYMQCMSAKVDFMNAYPGCQFDPSCVQAAENYANSVCTQFVNTYPNDYKQAFPL